jgi:hypothetical protein
MGSTSNAVGDLGEKEKVIVHRAEPTPVAGYVGSLTGGWP